MSNDTVQIWETRTEEQPYAFLSDKESKDSNRYGQKINLREINPDWEEGQSMHINGNPEVGENPNRNKQHGFFFTADNCIGCHACEAACSEKNENPGHIAFRSVGYVEGGSFPNYQRMNISMACNHCDDPVCLKGCPTNAYTKHTEYGAVLQDPETCFGCGYCTWVCPYNAPQLDPIKGEVSKCNMCVDRLEVGLKPSCVSACLGNALDFGVIENIPENREEALTTIPGFPDPSITHPNIRFQQTKGMPEEVSRTDSSPVKYHRNEKGEYKPQVDQKNGLTKYWNLGRLSSRENPLVLFTLLSQMSIGAFAISLIASLTGISSFETFRNSNFYAPFAITTLLLIGFGMFMSTTHLGKPMRFYRGFNNLRYSPVCREGLGIAIFMAMLAFHILFSLPADSTFQYIFQAIFSTEITSLIAVDSAQRIASTFGCLALLGGASALYYMYRCYRIKARPFWNHWQAATDFGGNALTLGALLTSAFILTFYVSSGQAFNTALSLLGGVLVLGLALQGIGLKAHARDMNGKEHEGAVSHYIQLSTFGKTYLFRNLLLGSSLLAGIVLLLTGTGQLSSLFIWAGLGLAVLCSSLIGRALFYVLVVPTTMPGAFFWKNKGFEEHARDIGLANMPQAGIVTDKH
ncbi:MAG: aspartate carbamoyltransferase [SAR86 cluster bacterium]|uniref:Aspartate carbamoyltransferase n=1 Tax=SAR86 cluster bacterium TaxID=2030880 RepID=A0A2A5CFX9_9GAMM|nr:MAG: aspartate carbamoyltransferase [SAR86 cluster bacterium]